MSVLSIRHYETAGDRLAELTWNGDEHLQASQPFAPQFDTFDLEDVRWYHENYRRNWRVSSNSTIQRIQRAERNLGEALHAALFRGSAAPLAEKVRGAGPDLRIEIRDEVHSAAIPWELIADPEAEQPLALTAASFVRIVSGDLDVPAEKTTHRLLLLISRPGGEADPGYWSVAYSLWRELARLPAGRAGGEYIDGATIGRILADSGVLLFSMNACRSADSKGSDRNLRATREPAIGQPSLVEDVLP